MNDQLRFRDPAEAMGFTIMPNCVLLSPWLSNDAKVVYLTLRLFARQNGHCFPGQQRLADMTGCSERHLRRLLGDLADVHLITWERPDKNHTNIYWLEPLADALPFLVPDRTPESGADRTPESGHEEHAG